jgi:hypothetical protein
MPCLAFDIPLDPIPATPEAEPTVARKEASMLPLVSALFDLSPQVRYIALLNGKDLSLHQRPGISGASESETDRYEELLVNPTVLTLLRRRGELDCGGLDHLWIRYGNFWTGVFPFPGGHLNVGLEPDATPTDFVAAIRAEMAKAGLSA